MAQITKEYLENQVSLNYQRLCEARNEGSKVLEDCFEQRMNNDLMELYDMLRFAARVARIGMPSKLEQTEFSD